MSHTKGRWFVMKMAHNGSYCGITDMTGPDPLALAEVFANTKEQREADARLIAAAPDLLDALVSLDRRLRICMKGAIWAGEAYDSFYQEVVAEAIAKARGQANPEGEPGRNEG